MVTTKPNGEHIDSRMTWETIAKALAAAMMMVIAWVMNGVRTDVNTLSQTVQMNHETLITEMGVINNRIDLAESRSQDRWTNTDMIRYHFELKEYISELESSLKAEGVNPPQFFVKCPQSNFR